MKKKFAVYEYLIKRTSCAKCPHEKGPVERNSTTNCRFIRLDLSHPKNPNPELTHESHSAVPNDCRTAAFEIGKPEFRFQIAFDAER